MSDEGNGSNSKEISEDESSISKQQTDPTTSISKPQSTESRHSSPSASITSRSLTPRRSDVTWRGEDEQIPLFYNVIARQPSRIAFGSPKALLPSLSYIITRSTVRIQAVGTTEPKAMRSISQEDFSGETVVKITEPAYTESQFDLPTLIAAQEAEVFFMKSIQFILTNNPGEYGEYLVRDFLSVFLDGTEDNALQVTLLVKRILTIPKLWEESNFSKIAKLPDVENQLVTEVIAAALGEVIEESMKQKETCCMATYELKRIRRDLRHMYYAKACRMTGGLANNIFWDALHKESAQRGSISAAGRAETNEKIIDADILSFCVAINFGLLVTSLFLPNNDITDFGVWHLANLIKNFDWKVVQLDLSGNHLTEKSAAILSYAISQCKSLHDLNISENRLGDRGGRYIAEALKSNGHLKTLDLTNTDLGMRSITALFIVVGLHPTLCSLKIGRHLVMSLQEEPLIHLAHLLKVNTVLQELHVPKFNMTDRGVGVLVAGLRQNFTLQHLDLSWLVLSAEQNCNKIVWDGGNMLAAYLKNNHTIQELNLHANRIQDAGATSIAKALATHNRTLKKLILTNNGIYGKGLCDLASCLESNRILTHLHIWGNRIETVACIAFTELLKINRLQLQCVDFIPYTTKDGVPSLAATHNPIDTHLFIEQNEINF